MKIQGKVYIREPWAREIVQGRKTIETAHIGLPERFRGQWLHVQNEHRQYIGAVRFSGSKRYDDVQVFDDDFKHHKVMSCSPYHYSHRKRTFGWTISEAIAYNEPLPAQPLRSQFRLEHIGG